MVRSPKDSQNLTGLLMSSLRKGYLFEFLSGHGGDFFITLASKCSYKFVGAWESTNEAYERLQEFAETGKMPGNNIGKKLIDGTWADYKASIQADMDRLQSDKPLISFCTHYGQNTVDILPHLEDWLQIPIEKVDLIPTTLQSQYWIDCFYDPIPEFQKLVPEKGIDQIDLWLNKPEELDYHVRRIGESLNWEWVQLTKDYYMEFKGKPFLDQDGI